MPLIASTTEIALIRHSPPLSLTLAGQFADFGILRRRHPACPRWQSSLSDRLRHCRGDSAPANAQNERSNGSFIRANNCGRWMRKNTGRIMLGSLALAGTPAHSLQTIRRFRHFVLFTSCARKTFDTFPLPNLSLSPHECASKVSFEGQRNPKTNPKAFSKHSQNLRRSFCILSHSSRLSKPPQRALRRLSECFE